MKLSTLLSSLGKYILHTHISLEKSLIDLLCEKEEPVVGQTQECTAGHNYFQQMVQFPEPDHLLLQVNLCAQVITLRSISEWISNSEYFVDSHLKTVKIGLNLLNGLELSILHLKKQTTNKQLQVKFVFND